MPMRGTLLIPLLLAVGAAPFYAEETPPAAGRSWYVAPTGEDAAPGTLEKPFATVQRAQRAARPGDTVFLRGGTYHMTESQIARSKGIFASITVLDRSG